MVEYVKMENYVFESLLFNCVWLWKFDISFVKCWFSEALASFVVSISFIKGCLYTFKDSFACIYIWNWINIFSSLHINASFGKFSLFPRAQYLIYWSPFVFLIQCATIIMDCWYHKIWAPGFMRPHIYRIILNFRTFTAYVLITAYFA